MTKKYFKLKPFILFILSISMLFMCPSIKATNTTNTVSDATHKQTIQQYVDRIKTLQNQIFFLNEYNLQESPKNKSLQSTNLTLANNEIENLREDITNYLDTIPSISSQNRDVALAFNSLTFLKNAVYQLILLQDATTTVEKNQLLQDFYVFNRLSNDTINVLDDIISRE